MRICIVAEGCYPYVVGGVSGWIHSMIKSFPNVEFVLLTLVANRTYRGKFVYELPENLIEVHEVYLEDDEWIRSKKSGSRTKLDKQQRRALRSLFFNQNVDWNTLFEMFSSKKLSLDDLLMGEDFLQAAIEYYEQSYPKITFSDFLWTLRSVYLPLFMTLKAKIPQADLYHCVATGYAGIMGCMGQYFHKGALLISEHGIYTREREEELIKANWLEGIYRDIWIQQFKKMSKAAYDKADMVTALYGYAKELQIDLGCPKRKISITPNGISVDRFQNLSGKTEEDQDYINVGAVLRVAPIKDVKTMIRAFSFAKQKVPNLKLWIMGPWDEEEEYAQECFEMVQSSEIPDIVFTDRVNVVDYLGRMDMTILTSISEGQPLTILESFAASKPVICTDVGACRELIYGNGDGFGTAGILTHIMDIDEIAAAMVELATNQEKCLQMGANGFQRVQAKYQIDGMKSTYRGIYRSLFEVYGKEWKEDNQNVG